MHRGTISLAQWSAILKSESFLFEGIGNIAAVPASSVPQLAKHDDFLLDFLLAHQRQGLIGYGVRRLQ